MVEADKYRIILIAHYKELYGANRSLLNLIDGLQALGVRDLLLVSPEKGDITEAAEKKNVTWIVIPFVNEITHVEAKVSCIKTMIKPVYNWLLVVYYGRRLKRKGKKNIIHTNASATLIGAYFSFWLRIPHVWHFREFGMIDYKFSYNFGYKYFRFWLKKAKAAIAISKSIYEKRLSKESLPQKPVIYNGVIFSDKLTSQKVNNKEMASVTDRIFHFGIVGFISAEKGQLVAIRAFNLLLKEYESIELHIAGTGSQEYLNLLQQEILELNLRKKIRFCGFIEDVNAFYKGINCLLMCSKNEGLGRVTIEAMSNGVPVIGYNNAGTAEIIIDSINGLLYSGEHEELYTKMKLLYENKALAESLSNQALNTVNEQFTIDAYSKAVYNVYQSLN